MAPDLMRRTAGACLLAALTACGGGGGSESGNRATPSGLLPTAPTPGVTLYGDATVFRPLRPFASWTYRGEQTSGPGSSPTVYTNVVSHTAATLGGVIENGTNPFNGGADSVALTAAGGSVHSSALLELVAGRPEAIEEVELRSPVRQDDQWTVLDREAASGLDLDQDGLQELLGVAIYKRVVGTEEISHPYFHSISTLRVRTHLVLRIKLSSTGAYTDPVPGMIDAWYAPGVGIVKLESDSPRDDGLPGRTLTTETLTRWDGVAQGMGALEPVKLRVPGGSLLKNKLDAVSFGTHALVLTAVDQDIELTSVAGNGVVMGYQKHAGLSYSGSRLLRMGDEARMVGLSSDGVTMSSFQNNGSSTSVAPVLLMPSPLAWVDSVKPIAAASTGNVLWLVYMPQPAALAEPRRLTLQGFNAAGLPVTSPSVLGSVSAPYGFHAVRTSSAQGRAIIAWQQETGLNAGQVTRYVVLTDSETAPVVHEAVSATEPRWFGSVTATETGYAMMWDRVQVPTMPASSIGALAIDGFGQPLRTSTADWTQELITLPWLSSPMVLSTSSGKHIDALLSDGIPPWPGEAAVQGCTLAEFTPSDTAQAFRNSARLLYRGPCNAAYEVVGLDAFVLLFSSDLESLTVTPVWRRP
jgi:hypothetical protein